MVDKDQTRTNSPHELRLRAEVESLGGLLLAFNPGTNKFYPNRLVLMPGGLSIFVETSTLPSTLSPGQRLQHSKLRRMDYIVMLGWTAAEVDEIIAVCSSYLSVLGTSVQ